MSDETRNVLLRCLELGRTAALALALAAVAACSGDGDGSVGIGQGQDPDPVAPDFPIAYTKGPLFDEDDNLLVNTDLRDILRFAKAEARAALLFPNPIDRMPVAVGKLENQIGPYRKRMEQSQPDACLRDVVHDAQKLAIGMRDLGRANQQRDARRAALVAVLVLVRPANRHRRAPSLR